MDCELILENAIWTAVNTQLNTIIYLKGHDKVRKIEDPMLYHGCKDVD